MIRARYHRGSYDDSMDTCVLINLTKKAMIDWIMAEVGGVKVVLEKRIRITAYGGVDPRNNWDTHIVEVDGVGVVGFIDGPFDHQFSANSSPRKRAKFMFDNHDVNLTNKDIDRAEEGKQSRIDAAVRAIQEKRLRRLQTDQSHKPNG